MDLPGLKKALAPGMSQVIEAGEQYTLTDDNGEQLELVGKLDPNTINFLRAFDIWLALELRLGNAADHTWAARASMIDAWNNLGNHAKKEIR